MADVPLLEDFHIREDNGQQQKSQFHRYQNEEVGHEVRPQVVIT